MDFKEKMIEPNLLIKGKITKVSLFRQWGLEIVGLTLYPKSAMYLETGTTYLSPKGEKTEGALDQVMENVSSFEEMPLLAVKYF